MQIPVYQSVARTTVLLTRVSPLEISKGEWDKKFTKPSPIESSATRKGVTLPEKPDATVQDFLETYKILTTSLSLWKRLNLSKKPRGRWHRIFGKLISLSLQLPIICTKVKPLRKTKYTSSHIKNLLQCLANQGK